MQAQINGFVPVSRTRCPPKKPPTKYGPRDSWL